MLFLFLTITQKSTNPLPRKRRLPGQPAVPHISILSNKPALAGEDSKQLTGSCLGDG
jgi:hypothetical protein